MNVWPRTSSRPPAHSEVPEPLSTDYSEACLVLGDSPKASAALSRRSLQYLLREHAGAKKKDLFDQIEEVIATRTLPAALADSLHQVRVIGNFAAHPTKSQTTGEIVAVEPHEAEWNLETLEMLFDFYFVLPAAAKKRREALDLKLKDAGKPPLPPSGSEKT